MAIADMRDWVRSVAERAEKKMRSNGRIGGPGDMFSRRRAPLVCNGFSEQREHGVMSRFGGLPA